MSGINRTPHREKLVSGLGGFVSTLVTFWLTRFFADSAGLKLVFIASMGATAVLLFAAPHGPLSQPWHVLCGHLVSALIGVALSLVMPDPVTGGALAVGLAIVAMNYLDCLHPPGGASALIPFLSAGAMPDYGFLFVLFPIGFGALSMTLIAVAFNWPFPWRRYPQSLYNFLHQPPPPPPKPYPDITHADLVTALSHIDTYVDISEEDLMEIYRLAMVGKATARKQV